MLPGIIWVVSTPMEVLTCGAEAQRTGPRPESLITKYSDSPTPDLSFPTYDLRTGISALPSVLLVSAPAGSHLPCPGIYKSKTRKWLKGQTMALVPEGIFLSSLWRKRASLLISKEKSPQSPYTPALVTPPRSSVDTCLPPSLPWEALSFKGLRRMRMVFQGLG